ncbi:retrovirus-related pol polyprotein from transposon TNT 1-94 [Tanacetum coccineum]
MDSIIPLGQKNTLAEYMILFDADNHPPMLDKDLHNSWKSIMELYMQNREHGRMILESVEHGLPADIYLLVNHHRVAKDLWEKVQLLMQGLAVHVFSLGDDPIACLNKAMAFLTAVASSRGDKGKVILTGYKSNATSSGGNNVSGQARVVKCYNCQGEGHMARQCTQLKRPRNATWYKDRAILAEAQEARQILDEEQLIFLADPGVPDGQAVQTIIPNNAAFQTEDLDTYDSDCDDVSNAKAVLMANISNYGSDVISEVPHSETYLNDMENQSVHAMQDFEQTPVMDVTDNEITSDSNIILYSQYLQETQQANVQDTNLQGTTRFNDLISAELERYKERVKTFEQLLNIDLSSREKMIDSQMDDMIKEKLALKEQVDSLKQNISKQIKEKESLLQTFTVFKNESKEKENKYMENEIDLEKNIKELDNIIFKVCQSAQTVHMLTKPQVFYDNAHKQALGYQNPFYLKKAQWIKPTLYDGIVISDKHVAMHVIDDEETLILEEESRSKMSEKEKDPEAIKQNISHKPIDYVKLNRLSEDFGKCFVPQQELSTEQTFWYHMSNPSSKSSDASTVKMEAPKELPKVSLVNESLKKIKFHLAKFDNVVKIRTTPDARTQDLLNEIMEVHTVFDQMDAAVQQSSVDKQCLEIAKKELLLENDRLLQQNMSQDVLLTMMNSMSLNEYFEKNDLKARLQDKDTTICKLKEIIKSMREKSKEENVNYDYCKIETKNVELENSVAKLLSKSERLCKEINHVKQVFKDQFDSIKKTRVRTKEQLEGKEIVDIAAQIPSANTIIPRIFKLNLDPLAPRLLQNREAHIDYLKYTQEQADILLGIVEQAKADVTPKNNVKKVRFVEPITSLSNIKQVESSTTSDSNTPVLSPTGLKCSTSNCGSKPTSNKKNDRISRTPSRNMKNKVEAQPRKVNKKNRVVEPIRDVDVKHSLLKANSELICATCKKSMFDGVHDMCLLDFVENVNSRAKSAKKHKKQNIWKPTGHVFTEVGLKWKPTGRTFTIVGNSCPLTRITSANVVPPKKTTSHSVETQKPKLKVYSRKPKNVKNVGSSKKAKIVESKNANHSEPNHTWGSNAIDIPSSSSLVMTGTVRFGNDHIARIMGYGDYQLGNVTISRVYYDPEIHNEYTISLDDMLKTSLICLLSKALKTKSWLWHRRLSHLHFGTINKLAKDGLARGIPRLKFQKDNLCSTCSLGKSKKSSHQLKAEDTN